MRKFWLKDGGTEHSMQSDELFFYAPTGLGFSTERDYSPVDDGFWAPTGGNAGQKEIAGTLVFRKNAYQKYREIVDFVTQAKALQIVYCPFGTQKYYMDVCMDLMEKSEISIGVLEVPVQIRGTSPWRSSNQMHIVSTGHSGGNIKRYGYRYPYHYSLTGVSGTAKFRIAGHFDGSIELRAAGPLTAPTFSVKNADTEEEYGWVDLSSISIAKDETLHYSSLVNNAGIWKTSGEEGKTDLIDSVELVPGIPLFMRIPTETWVIAELVSESSADTAFDLTVYEYWKTR